ncbi:MAG: hypothetical protein AAB437_03370 [Patescibacteria group bacterium]
MKKLIVIIIVLVVSFLLSFYAINNIFLAKTPKVNPYYFENLSRQINLSIINIAQLFKTKNMRINTVVNYDNPAEIPDNFFKIVSKGVSAYEKSPNEVYLRIDKGTRYKIKEIKLNNGKVFKAIDLTGN